ncbi:1-phosphatidylinositol-3-phosphate 5-kinase FAB1B [Arachis duranensis]|uniref:1-phosphatidylinositol-3-phosphate 5-kinase n=1 Tax=Arachis duranensis TaxID=130453 RepID=A0A6P4DR17_ARADU|nr:1-phosphatidylinositol-3-phosphate 5-kinase FAB1B [Arachis duranensis]XP_015972447.1 1-phosphatidylinositol-3-phosphate 5-kinase FAB1B [Arachis duranensis]XP_015972464.1 1-phosphatidylinositol-3-phosphate 5-kinase FAB1B [Arachis duranensis]XP_020998613.1 1-phosphatidylinositol-3-phosphate 5-kinase FAB1B [Arachis duranensis]XP_052116886.1 1-phosphatidylinositol-3-phosphate 5-kinase FAB1B [Arachis duranensis]
MGTPDKKISDLVDVVRSWIPRRAEPPNVSRDFWMPDQSCRVCYECDSQFTIFNRRHHCRICGRVFCAKCTANSVPALSDESKSGREDWDRIRVCNYCFKQWEQGLATVDNVTPVTPCLSPSPSATSLVSTKSSSTCHSSSSTVGSTPYSTGPYQRVPYISPQSSPMDLLTDRQENLNPDRCTNPSGAVGDLASNQFGYCFNRSDDDDDDYVAYHSDTESRHYSHVNDYEDPINIHGIDHVYEPHEMHHNGDNVEAKSLSCATSPSDLDLVGIDGIQEPGKADQHDHVEGCISPPYNEASNNIEPVDFENNGLLWLPPEPEDEEDDREAVPFDDDEDDGTTTTGEWGYLQSSVSFGSGEYRSRDKSGEEHRKALKTVVEGHFRALVAQLLQVENIPSYDENGKDSWLDIITALSWEAATLLKPDMSRGGGMDPGGYVKVKCIACGHRNESMVVKGVVCKKNVAHRRMTSKFDKPRFLILGGALEYQRISNQLSSVDTLLQQEMDHLKMAVAKIGAHHPNVLLVEKSVSRYAQEYLLAKDISLVLNIKKPLLERIARCTGAQIVPSIDHLTSQKVGYCEAFHVDKFFEEHGSAGQCGKKSTKTLMFFEGCPKPLGCTILLRGASGDELKKVKHVVQYGVFAAYHLALETSFLADEGASPLEFPLKSPITVALPDKPSCIERSISTIPGYSILTPREHQGAEPIKIPNSNYDLRIEKTLSTSSSFIEKPLMGDSVHTHEVSGSAFQPAEETASSYCSGFLPNYSSKAGDNQHPKDFLQYRQEKRRETMLNNDLTSDSFGTLEPSGSVGDNQIKATASSPCLGCNPEPLYGKHDNNNRIYDDMIPSKEDFPPSTSDHQSILVFLSTRCVWKGTVCERSHLVRIKYYGSSDKPLGRFLRDQLFDQSYICRSCDMPSEAHVHCYTHRQGSLTISVKKLSEFPLPGEREGKIWMWHRCLKCPRVNGFPPATRRVVMSDAAWGLSFGKFLELSFSNHAAASRVASCGHSLHRDCLRFYGFGKMVACFRYASIDLHSVYLPPPKLEFNYDSQDWLKREAIEVQNRAEVLFSEVRNVLHQLLEKVSDTGLRVGGNRVSDVKHLVSELKEMVQKEREELEDLLQKLVHKEVKAGQPVVDILELNKLRRHILLLSFVWDQRLIYASNLFRINFLGDPRNSCQREKSIGSREKVVEADGAARPARGHSSFDSSVLESKPDGSHNLENASNLSTSGEVTKGGETGKDTTHDKVNLSLSAGANVNDKSESPEIGGSVRRALSEGEFPIMGNLSDTLDAAWTGETHPINGSSPPDSAMMVHSPEATLVAAKSNCENYTADNDSKLLSKGLDTRWPGMPFANPFSSINKTSVFNSQKLVDYNPVHILSFRELERQNGARLLLHAGINDAIVAVYDDEPTSIISYVLMSIDYHVQMSESDKAKDSADSSVSLPLFDTTSLLSLSSFDESIASSYRSFGSSDESMLSTAGSQSLLVGDPLLYTKDLHARVSFSDDSNSLAKVKYTVTCYFAKRFEALRRTCCPSETDFVRSLSRCKKWGAQGGKSNVFFAKTLDDRFIIKQVTKTELESFIKFAPAYFKYLSESISTGSPTCLAKILGIYQVTSKHLKGGKETKMDVLVMENLLYRRNIRRLYDLKGSSRSRYNPDTTGSNKVLLDQNLIESMPTSPIFVGNKAKRLLERAVWNDTAFLASIYVMDYSLLVGVDEDKHELVLGIIDFMRQYTWDKHLETWVKTSGILGGPKNTSPTVISPQQYKKRFRKAMSAYFLMVPDQWSPPDLHPGGSQSEFCDENS